MGSQHLVRYQSRAAHTPPNAWTCLRESALLVFEAPLSIGGAIHCRHFDLLRPFEFRGFPPESKYLFMGECVGRCSRLAS